MGLARWRGERTASVAHTRDGQGWVDFGASARRANGRQDGGDALELEARISEQSKPEVMRQIARELVREARAALESAAQSGKQPLAWVQEFMTPAGWAHYQKLRDPAGAIPAATVTNEPARGPGGLAGFHPDTTPSVPSGSYPRQRWRRIVMALLL